MKAEKPLQPESVERAAASGQVAPETGEASAARRSAALRLRRLQDRQNGAGDGLSDLGPPPRNLLALFR